MSTEIQAIDVHAHYGAYQRKDGPPLINQWLSADAARVAERARQANVRLTIVSPLSGLEPQGEANAVAANREADTAVRQTPGLLQWVIVHPHQPETFRQANELLPRPHVAGIKIHPEAHQYPITQHGDALFELAERHRAIVLAHSGDPFSWPEDLVVFANRYPGSRLILAHLGNGGGAAGDPTLQVRAVHQAEHSNVWIDTSSARSLLPGLVEWAVREVGGRRILFGTDTPLYSTAMQRARIDSAELSNGDKADILHGNAERLFSEMVQRPGWTRPAAPGSFPD